ncbi:PAS domain S-box protein [Thiomicrospira microaerophila]|uniref:methyl-accepting chemotaxis protein n=1 Tax=Thiomicrospira microaerophila TaxID=406020 RepID=UPI00200C6352|nr:methyl-accepting chemotaxis protein [Thiomicrospira microaerophila]UQB42641.1 PAS domain S-box protein [Thiomicrospira microaerophila]
MMRNNHPITEQEHLLSPNLTLVSKTDLKGTIIDCNDAFEAASGFSRKELLGQPHNLVRHPDVPQAVFADMWADLQQGIPWTQYIKNRHKDGGFYWVRAQATPLYKDGKISGFLSVRNPISAQEKQQATQNYQLISSGQAKIKHGKIYQGMDIKAALNSNLINPGLILGSATLLFAFLPILTTGFDSHFSPLNIILAGLLVLFMFGYGMALNKTQRAAIQNLQALAAGEDLRIQPTNPKSFSALIHNAIQSVNLAFKSKTDESAHQLDEANQLRFAFDKLKSSVMMIDDKFNITYSNENMNKFLLEREAKLKQLAPHFDAANLIGKNIDIFHKHPGHQRAMISKMQEPSSVRIEIGGFHLELAMLPIKNRANQRVATLVEWIDRTQEVQLLNHVAATVKRAQNGYLGERIDVDQLEGVAHELSTSINQLMDGIQVAMNDVIRVTSAMSEGDLGQQIENNFEGELGELKEAINLSIDRLKNTIDISVTAAQVVDSAAQDVSQGSRNLSLRVQDQVSAVEESTTTIEQMNANIQLNNHNTQQASQVALGVQVKAQQGEKVMGQTIEAMQHIQESSYKIADIVTIIDSIAFQTNLLALNAAVEAARAGDHGRGFAVVAGEVRALAQKSADAAKEIKNLISESVQRIDQGTRLASESGDVLKQITHAVDEVTGMIQQIANASAEQALGIQQVQSAIVKIDSLTQQNAHLVEQTASASESMREQAKALNQEMAFFNTQQYQVSGHRANNKIIGLPVRGHPTKKYSNL